MGELKTICLDNSDENADWIKAVTKARESGIIQQEPAESGSILNSFEDHAGRPGLRGGSLPKGQTNPDEPEYKIKGRSDSEIVEFEAGGRTFTGKVVEPFSLPPRIPVQEGVLGWNKNSFMESMGGSERMFIDFPARRMWFLKKQEPEKPGTVGVGEDKPSSDGWVVKSSGTWYPKVNTMTDYATQEVKPVKPVLPDDVEGSAAYMKRLGLTYSTGSAYDEELNLGHQYGGELNSKEQDITNPNNIPASVGGVFRYEGKMEARALGEKCRLTPLEDLISKDKSESFQGDKTKEYVTAKYDKVKEVYAKVSQMSRGDALDYLAGAKSRAENKNEKQFQEASKKAEAIPHDTPEGWENVSAFWKSYFRSNVEAAKSNAFSLIKADVKNDFIRSLVPQYPVYDDKKILFDTKVQAGLDSYELGMKTDKAVKFINSSINPASIGDMVAKPLDISWRESLAKGGGVNAFDRSYYSPAQKEIVMRPDADDATVAHELGHHLAQVTFGDNYARDFIYDRAERTTQPLRRMTGDLGYTEDEIAHADRFINQYVGKEYPGSTTEVVAMGVEHMMRDPVWFYEHDREHFLFTKYVMDGGLRRGYDADLKKS